MHPSGFPCVKSTPKGPGGRESLWVTWFSPKPDWAWTFLRPLRKSFRMGNFKASDSGTKEGQVPKPSLWSQTTSSPGTDARPLSKAWSSHLPGTIYVNHTFFPHYPSKRKLKPGHENLRLRFQVLTASENKEKILFPTPDFLLKQNLWDNYQLRVILLQSCHRPLLGVLPGSKGTGGTCSGFLGNVLFGDFGEIIWKDYFYDKTNMDILWSANSYNRSLK